MKKIIATILAIGGLALCASAQGTFFIDSSGNSGDGATTASTTGGLVFINGVLDTATDINLAILWGTSAATVTTPLNLDPFNLNTGIYAGNNSLIASQATGSGDITWGEDGTIVEQNGLQYTVSGSGTPQLRYGWCYKAGLGVPQVILMHYTKEMV